MTGAEQWLGGAAVLGVLTALWGKIKVLSWRLVNLLVVRARLDGDAGLALSYYCWTEFYRSPFGEKRYNAAHEFVQPLDRYQAVGYEQTGYDSTVFWKKWRPLLVGLGTSAMEGGGNTGWAVTVSFIRGTFDLDQLIVTALDKLNQLRHAGEQGNRYTVRRCFGSGSMRTARRGGELARSTYRSGDDKSVSEGDANNPDRRYLKWTRQQLGMPHGDNDPFTSLAFPPDVLEAVERCRRWLHSEAWYKGKEIPWRLGVLLYGRPGCGKTSFVRAVGRALNLPIFSYDLASFGNQDFEQEWQGMMNNTPCVALLEDVDAVFDGRDNRLGDEGGGLTFDCLLNCIGGVKDANGVLLFVTTNRPECLDDALGKPGQHGVSTRPGRVDIAVELGELDDDCRRRLAQKILCDCPEYVEEHVGRGVGMTGAQFTELCGKTALAHYWRDGGRHIKAKPVAPRPVTVVNGAVQKDDWLYDQREGRWTTPPAQRR